MSHSDRVRGKHNPTGDKRFAAKTAHTIGVLSSLLVASSSSSSLNLFFLAKVYKHTSLMTSSFSTSFKGAL